MDLQTGTTRSCSKICLEITYFYWALYIDNLELNITFCYNIQWLHSLAWLKWLTVRISHEYLYTSRKPQGASFFPLLTTYMAQLGLSDAIYFTLCGVQLGTTTYLTLLGVSQAPLTPLSCLTDGSGGADSISHTLHQVGWVLPAPAWVGWAQPFCHRVIQSR